MLEIFYKCGNGAKFQIVWQKKKCNYTDENYVEK